MSLSGQWVARYAGSSSGTLVIELDDVGDRYEGTACVWPNSLNSISAFVRFLSLTKENTQRVEGVLVQAMYNNGNFLTLDEMQRVRATEGFVFPEKVDIELALVRDELSINWTSSVATGTAIAPRTKGGLPSELKPLPIRSWGGFKKYVNSLERKRYVFRGQENSEMAAPFELLPHGSRQHRKIHVARR
jgi:hypothetical protein